MIGNKIADKTTSASKPKNKGVEEDKETNKVQEIGIPQEKREQIIDDLRLFLPSMKMEYQKNTNLLCTTIHLTLQVIE